MTIRGILFDLDGTLLDTLSDLAGSVNRVLASHGYPTHEREAYRLFIGNGAKNLLSSALPEAVSGDEGVVQRCLSEFRSVYKEHDRDETLPYPGIEEMLAVLSSQKIPMGILSNKPHDATVTLVQHFFGDNLFSVVLGQRPELPRKPDPTAALCLAKEMNILPSDILLIGDSGSDMLTASAAGMIPAGVTWGFRSMEELRTHGATRLFHTPEEITEFITQDMED